MKVLQILESTAYGGAERVALGYCRSLVRLGYEAALAVSSNIHSEVATQDLRNCQLMVLQGAPWGPISWKRVHQLYRVWVAAGKPRVIHSHQPRVALAIEYLRALRIIGASHVRTVHLASSWTSRTGRILSLLGGGADAFICVSDEVLSCTIRSVSSNRICTLIPSYFAVLGRTEAVHKELARAHLSLDEQETIIVTGGRLTEQKGIDIAVRALRSLRDVPDWHCLILGDGPERPRLEHMVRSEGLGECIRFVGWTSNPMLYYSAADVFLLSSREEGMPVALAEAIEAGCIPICFEVGGVRQLVKDGETGIIVPFGNEMALAVALRALVSDRNRRAAIRRNIQTSMRRRSPEEQDRLLRDLYHEVVCRG